MAIWECGTCGASFATFNRLDSHEADVHAHRDRPTAPRVPHSSPVKPLRSSDVTHGEVRDHQPNLDGGAQDIRTGAAREDVDTSKRPEPHPTGLDERPPSYEKDRGRQHP